MHASVDIVYSGLIISVVRKMTHPTLFNEKRTAQAAAFMLYQAGGRLPLLKLMKLLYLAERESLREFGEPISSDNLVSTPHGPVLSVTLDMMNGWGGQTPDGRNTWVEDRADHAVALRDPSMIRPPEQDLLELSNDDLETLQNIWLEFGHMSQFELLEYTHSSACPEWLDPHGTSHPIPVTRLLEAVGYKGKALQSVMEHLEEQALLNATLN